MKQTLCLPIFAGFPGIIVAGAGDRSGEVKGAGFAREAAVELFDHEVKLSGGHIGQLAAGEFGFEAVQAVSQGF